MLYHTLLWSNLFCGFVGERRIFDKVSVLPQQTQLSLSLDRGVAGLLCGMWFELLLRHYLKFEPCLLPPRAEVVVDLDLVVIIYISEHWKLQFKNDLINFRYRNGSKLYHPPYGQLCLQDRLLCISSKVLIPYARTNYYKCSFFSPSTIRAWAGSWVI